MGSKLSFIPDDEPNKTVQRYEAFLSHKQDVSGYFDVEEFESIVDYYLKRGRTKDSAKALEIGFKLHPGSPVLMTKRAKNYLAVGETQKAYRILESHSEAGDYEVILLKIEALFGLERNKEAMMLADKLIETEKHQTDNACLDIAYVLIAQSEIDLALKYLKKGDEFNPKNQDLLYELAFCQEHLLLTVDAIKTYHRITKLDSFSAEAWFNLGQIYFGLNKYSEALIAYGYAQTIKPEDALTTLQKAHCHFQIFQYEEALTEYKLYESQSTDNWQIYLFIGECYERLELFGDAMVYYRKSLDESPENFEALTGIAICLLEEEKYQESLQYIRRAIEVRDDAADAWVYLAEALTGIEDMSGALLAYIKSIQLEPNQPDTLMAIANICMEQGDFQIAVDYYKEAMRLDFNNELENINLFMAVAFFKIDDFESSANSLKLAMNENLDALNLFYELCPEAVK